MKKKRTIAEFSAIIGELAKSVNETYYSVKVEITNQSNGSKMVYVAYINGFNHQYSDTMDGCITGMKIQMGVTKPTIDNIVCE